MSSLPSLAPLKSLLGRIEEVGVYEALCCYTIDVGGINAAAIARGLPPLLSEPGGQRLVIHSIDAEEAPLTLERGLAAFSVGLLARAHRRLREWLAALEAASAAAGTGMPHTLKGQPGRRGYPLKALAYAKELRKKHPDWKLTRVRGECLKKFHEDDLPDADNFRRWLNRQRANRAN